MNQIIRVHVDYFFGEEGTIVIDISDFHAIHEGLKVELFQQGCLGSLDLFALSTALEVLGDFDLSLDDLGTDVQGMEEVDLRRVQACRARGASEIDRR